MEKHSDDNITGKSINQKDLILALLNAIKQLDKVEICKCAAHITNTDPVAKGNRKADEEGKKSCSVRKTPLQRGSSHRNRPSSVM